MSHQGMVLRVVLTMALGCPLMAVVVSAQTTEGVLPFSTVGFQSGVVDELQSATIRIDGRSYVLKPNVLVIDHEGQPLELARIVRTSLVCFHLKEGHIDKMMVKLPQ